MIQKNFLNICVATIAFSFALRANEDHLWETQPLERVEEHSFSEEAPSLDVVEENYSVTPLPEVVPSTGYEPAQENIAASSSGTQLHECLKGLVLVGACEEIYTPEEVCCVDCFETKGLLIPGGESKLRERLLPLYMNKELTQESLAEIKKTILDYFHEYYYPLVVIQVPEQDITCGVLQLVLIEGKLGNVCVEGNQYFSDARFRKYLNLMLDETINERDLIRSLNFMNRNPFRRVDVIYAPGTEPGQTDVTLFVDDRRPLRIYSGVENSGVRTTNRQRWLAGFNWGDAFWLDHVLAYQFTSSYQVSDFHSHTAQYIAPLSWQHILNIYGGYARVDPDLNSVEKNTGRSYQASGRYGIPLPPTRYLYHEFTFGYDWKRTNNVIQFNEFAVTGVNENTTGSDPDANQTGVGQNVNISQFVLGYSGNYEKPDYRVDFGVDMFISPGKMMSDQSKEDYETLRLGADNDWVIIQGQLAYLKRLRYDFSVLLTASGQWTYQNLLPSEQFVLGGYDTVRGYDQRQENFDSGYLFNGEIRTPAMRILKYMNESWTTPDGLQFLVFLDYGRGWDHTAVPGTPKSEWLMGAGPGVRYTIVPYFTARCDLGFKLHNNDFFTGGSPEVHFSVIASF
ncbi:MAG: ShlB/FhaC/HecB family hemolysin secretion/activation protein [Candidatus Algichlamydia australiensis]|nr:ShlB/FhaC/HecB family hemolysin secretion/activation protein [Chlamydiales bacterium]